MRVALAEVGRRGRIDLTFSLQNGQTILRNAYCEIPFKITRVLNSRPPAAHLILMHCTAGVFGGDDLECSIRVERGGHAVVTQQAATRIHPSEGSLAIQRNRIIVETGAILELYFEPIIPFAGSSFEQTTSIDVQPGARLVFWEGLMAGRVGRGECWQFRRLDVETQLRSNDHLRYLDRFRLVPDGRERSPRVMGDSTYLGTGLYVGDDADQFIARLHEALPEAGTDVPSEHLAVSRVVSPAGPDFHRSYEKFRRC